LKKNAFLIQPEKPLMLKFVKDPLFWIEEIIKNILKFILALILTNLIVNFLI
jgi:hypothetical protein